MCSSPSPIRQFRNYIVYNEFADYLSGEIAQSKQWVLDTQARYDAAEYSYVMPMFATGASYQACGALHPIQKVNQRQIDNNPHPVLKEIKVDVDQHLEAIRQSTLITTHYHEWAHRYLTAKMGGNKAQGNEARGNKRKRRGEAQNRAQRRAQSRTQDRAPASNNTGRQRGTIKHERQGVKKETREYYGWIDVVRCAVERCDSCWCRPCHRDAHISSNAATPLVGHRLCLVVGSINRS